MSAQHPACQLLQRYYDFEKRDFEERAFEEHAFDDRASEDRHRDGNSDGYSDGNSDGGSDERAGLWVVAPPRDDWLLKHASTMVSGDSALRHHWLERQHTAVSPFDEAIPAPHGQVVLFWPKAHQLGVWWLEWLCRVLPEGTPVDIVGEHQGGVKRVPKVLAEYAMRCDKLDNARRCSLFATRTIALGDPERAWSTFEAEGLTLASHPGVFGHGKVDEGTQRLLAQLASVLPTSPQRILDMGCGDGIIAAWLARRGHVVTAVDVSAFAVQACQRTLAANGLEARVLESDVYSALGDERFDVIVSNPPFHQERDISYGPSATLMEQAPQHLTPRGTLLMVANAFLPYPDLLERTFGGFDTLDDNRRFKVYRAQLR